MVSSHIHIPNPTRTPHHSPSTNTHHHQRRQQRPEQPWQLARGRRGFSPRPRPPPLADARGAGLHAGYVVFFGGERDYIYVCAYIYIYVCGFTDRVTKPSPQSPPPPKQTEEATTLAADPAIPPLIEEVAGRLHTHTQHPAHNHTTASMEGSSQQPQPHGGNGHGGRPRAPLAEAEAHGVLVCLELLAALPQR